MCGTDPVTGFFRDGHCNTCAADQGSHTVCAVMTAEFLAFSKYVGNDLSTPNPAFGFAGLKPGDPWCLCAGRFMQAAEEGCGPLVHLGRDAYPRIGARPLRCIASTRRGDEHECALLAGLLSLTSRRHVAAQDIRPQEQARLDRFERLAGTALLEAMAQGAADDVDALSIALSGTPQVAFDPSLQGEWRCRTMKLGG